MERRVLKLKFKDDYGKMKTLSLNYPKIDLNSGEIKDAMDKIIASGVVETKEGKVVKIDQAYIENIARQDFPLELVE